MLLGLVPAAPVGDYFAASVASLGFFAIFGLPKRMFAWASHLDTAAKLWTIMALTVGIFVLGWSASRRSRPQANADERIFEATLLGTGALQGVLQLIAFTVGLSFASAAAAATVLLVVGSFLLRRVRVPAAPPLPDAAGRSTRPLAVIVAVVLATLLVQWIGASASSLEVVGTDAAHYHVPHAISFAQGATPFEPLATEHLYPMGTSVLMAWFILPMGDVLLVDLALAIPFFLIWASLAAWIRLATDRPGFAWAAWLVIAMHALPLAAGAALPSADLFYTAAFLALNTQLARMWFSDRRSTLDVLLAATAAGLVVAAKTNGTVSWIVLIAVHGVAASIYRQRERIGGQAELVTPFRLAAGAAVLLLLGGVWWFRNLWNFGSPTAPLGVRVFGVTVFPGATLAEERANLSVLNDLATVYGHSLWMLADRLAWAFSRCLGSAFLPAVGLGVAAVSVDAIAASWRKGQRPRDASGRMLLIGVVAATFGVHLIVLAGAPWTSLEWTGGFALRFVLPEIVLAASVALLVAFPMSLPPRLARRFGVGATGALVGVGIWRLRLPMVDGFTMSGWWPNWSWQALSIAVAALIALYVTDRAARHRRGLAVAVAFGLMMAAAAVSIAAKDANLRTAAFVALGSRRDASRGEHHQLLLAALAAEQEKGRMCAVRRFWITTRFNLPLDLQTPDLRTHVLNTATRAEVWRAVRDASGPGVCDYFIADRTDLSWVRAFEREIDRGRLTWAAHTRTFVLFTKAVPDRLRSGQEPR